MPDAGEHLRAAGAATRALLRELAASRLGVSQEQVELSGGTASVGGKDAVGYGELVKGLRRLELVGPSAQPTPPSAWTTAGRPTVSLGAREIVTGARRYTSDLRPPGLMIGKVLYPPTYGARPRGVDLERARALPGVVATHEGDLVAVAAPDLPRLKAAVKAVKVEWEASPQPSEANIVQYLREHPERGADSWDVVRVEEGKVDAALASAPVRLQATYTVSYIAHVPLEPHAVMASWEGGRLSVAMGSQTPFRAREVLAGAFGVEPAAVHVTVPPTGAGFGGKHAGELAVAAARLAKAAGRPVMIRYTREEEFTQAYFRPLAVIDIRSGAEKDGTLTAWQFHDLNGGAAGARLPYRVPNQRITNQPSESPLREGPYRAIGATANNFAREVHVDEIAARVGADPVEFRRRHLADDRLATVLRAVAEKAAWVERKVPPSGGRAGGTGRGIAVGLEKGGRVATFAEVQVHEDRRLEVRRLVTGYEAGAIVHPSNLRSQVEGATVMGLGGALFEAVHFEQGRILNPRLSEYRVPRFHDVPPIEVILLDRRDLPSQGGGETPIIAVAPAVANAIFDATGTRLRAMPLAPDGTVP